MSFEFHLASLLVALVAFAIWPNVWPRRSFKAEASIGGTPCNFKQQRVTRSNKAEVTVTLPCDQRFEFKLSREGSFDRAAKIMGLAREFQTNDERFDQAIYIGADEQGVDDWLAGDQTSRGIVLDLLTTQPQEDTKVSAIEASRGVLTLSAVCNPPMFVSAPDDLGLQIATTCVPRLNECLERLKTFAAGNSDLSAFRDPYAIAFRTLVWLAIGFMIVPWVFFLIESSLSPLIEFSEAPLIDRYGLMASGLVIGSVALLAIVFMRGSARLHSALASLVVLAGIGAPVAAVPLVRELNAQWDRTAPRPHSSHILQRYHTGGRHRTYHLVLTDWHDSENQQDLTVDDGTYDAWGVGDDLTVWEGNGYLNEPWISALTRPDSRDQAASR